MVDSCLFRHGSREMCRLCWVYEIRRLERDTLRPLIDVLWDKMICAYCGEGATDVEHVVARVHGEPTWTVPSCRECNGLAGAKLFYTFAEKRDYIHDRIRRKYRSVLKAGEFDREELAEMGPGLRRLLTSATEAKGILEQRLGFELELSMLDMSTSRKRA